MSARLRLRIYSPARIAFWYAAGTLSPAPAIVTFKILPPFWKRWWFLALAALSIGLAAYALYRYRVAQIIEVERVRTRIASDLHDDIGASLSRVAILSEVVRQQTDGGGGEAAGRLAEIAGSARDLVDSMSDIVWSVDPRRDNLENIVTRLRQFGSDVFEAQGIGWELRVAPQVERIKLGPEQRRDIFLICKEALTNAARHANCKHVTLSFNVAGPQILIEISDDGGGFQTSPNAPAPTGNGRGGHGLVNMRTRATRLGADLEITSGHGRGTQLKLSTPRYGRVHGA
jgi:signal transduction histidine kinase